ncbi:hypothetical protein FO519_010099, partial [Halicephalobus sp. NKZ332]
MSADSLKIQNCSQASYCYTKYYNDGQNIIYELGCDENLVCQANGCTISGLTRTCCCNSENSCITNGASDPIEYSFPADFKFGVATSSYQIEGAYKAEKKGPSIWDIYTHKPNKIRNNDTGDIACDSYNNYQRDVDMLKELGVKEYRFSISWPRIFPDGTNATVNEDGVEYYNNLINALLDAKIDPIVTMFHWDLPQYLQDMGGFLDSSVADRFGAYAD